MGWLWVFLSGDSDYVDDKSLAEAGKLKDQRARELAIKEQAEAAAREKDALQNAEKIGKLKEKIASGELSTKIRTQVQARHIEGTPEFEKYRSSRLEKGQTPQSILSIAEGTPQEIVDKCVGTGTVVIKERKDGSYEIKEYTDADRVIGKYYAYCADKSGGKKKMINIWEYANSLPRVRLQTTTNEKY